MKNMNSKIIILSVFFILLFFSIFSLGNSNKNEVKTIHLTSKNSVALDGNVNQFSITNLILDMRVKLKSLPQNEDFYIVINTNGGYLNEGLKLISYVNGLNRKVHTISVKSISTGFHIVQNLGNRYITLSGYVMSHRTSLEKRMYLPIVENTDDYASLKQFERLDRIAAKRMKISYEEYLKLITIDFYAYDEEAVKKKCS